MINCVINCHVVITGDFNLATCRKLQNHQIKKMRANFSAHIIYDIPYSGYFSRGINFRGFRGQLASAKN